MIFVDNIAIITKLKNSGKGIDDKNAKAYAKKALLEYKKHIIDKNNVYCIESKRLKLR